MVIDLAGKNAVKRTKKTPTAAVPTLKSLTFWGHLKQWEFLKLRNCKM